MQITSELINSLLNSFSTHLVDEGLARTLNVPKNHFILQKTKIEFDTEGVLGRIKAIEYKALIDPVEFSNQLYGTVTFSKPANSSVICIEKNYQKEFEDADKKQTIIENIKIFLFHYLMNIIFNDAHSSTPFYLPASRLFFPSFYAYIVKIERDKSNEFINKLQSEEGASDEWLKWFGFRPYTQAGYQLIDALLSKIGTSTNGIATNHESYLRQLEHVIGGKIRIERKEGVAPPLFHLEMKRKKEPLAIHLASSSVNQLTALYLYFKYWANNQQNLLIIDEPEENLSIDNQVKITDLLLQFAKSNQNRVVITTHSPSIAENINNHIYLDILRKETTENVDAIIEEEGLGIRGDISIGKEEVGAYYFDGRRIIDYQDEHNYGIYFKNFIQSQDNIRRIGSVLTDYIYTSKEAESEQ